MATWDIDVHAVRGVVAHAGSAVSDFEERVRMADGNADGLELGAVCSPRVVQALQMFRQALKRDDAEAGVQANAATTAAQSAVGAYNQADHEMVLNAQRQAASATDPSAWMPGGGRA